jgi:hypothetical protein
MLAGILGIKSTKTLTLNEKLSISIVICTSFVALFLGYIFVEVYPLSMFAKLQLARTTPFAQLMVLIVISVLINEFFQQGNFILCLLLLITPIVPNGAVILFVISTILSTNKLVFDFQSNQRGIKLLVFYICLFGIISILSLYPVPSITTKALKEILWIFMAFAILVLPFFIERFISHYRTIKPIIYVSTCLATLFLLLGISGHLPKRLLGTFQGRIKIQNTYQGDFARLAMRFRELSNINDVILVTPSSNEFRLYSQRAVVFSFKGFPFTDSGMLEWQNRMVAILGKVRPPLSLDNVDLIYQNRSSSDLVKAAKKFGANYILTKTSWHQDMPGTVILQQGEWSIYKVF